MQYAAPALFVGAENGVRRQARRSSPIQNRPVALACWFNFVDDGQREAPVKAKGRSAAL